MSNSGKMKFIRGFSLQDIFIYRCKKYTEIKGDNNVSSRISKYLFVN